LFGYSVSIDGDTVVIGAWKDDDKGDSSGSAYVYTRDTAGDLASNWTQVAKLTAGDGAVNDVFGYSVSIDGDTVVIGAHYDDDKGLNSGSAYVYTRDTAGDLASNWTQVAKLTADDGAADDYFGRSVSIDGSTVVIGAHYDDDKGSNSGSAYVFARDTAGDLASNWTQIAKLTADDRAVNDNFGYSVSIDGDTMVIGAWNDDDKGLNSGSAYVFTRDTAGELASNWTQVDKLNATDGAAGDEFGYSVSIDGDTIVIGARLDNDKGSASGSAYVFSIHFPPCDASSPPANGAVGDCTSVFESGTTCQPVCDPGYAVSGPSTCKDGVLSPAVCIGVLHLVADDITDVDAGNLVQSWSDHTGNGLSLSSFVAAPELVDGGNISTGALFNGHKAVRFGESGITGLSLPTSALQLSTSLEGNDRRRGDEHGRQSGCHRSVPVRPR
jgi:hypothetical protein